MIVQREYVPNVRVTGGADLQTYVMIMAQNFAKRVPNRGTVAPSGARCVGRLGREFNLSLRVFLCGQLGPRNL